MLLELENKTLRCFESSGGFFLQIMLEGEEFFDFKKPVWAVKN